ncbi:uncharacterized protein LOC129744912 [Uranotaenia lowii]|uniref:uncharacterized protein LOC129744912 n=1 Tax=Uranotaenia lowii TaxID=190385 RepID=UPI002479A7F9|nr:uncharacterized protein LOC129744912 [Uranotaenia lowii]
MGDTPMELNVSNCCRLCLKDASSDRTAPIDLILRPDVGGLINELYGLNIKKTERGSKYICWTCYKDGIKLQKQLQICESKKKLIALNQQILQSQEAAFPDLEEDDSFSELPTRYRPPTATPAKVQLQLDDCMRSAHFRELLLNPFELGHIRVSGPIYQDAINSYIDMWYPVQSFCSRCRQSFWDPTHFEEHLVSCKHKCLFCRRAYSAYESWKSHTCSRRDHYRKTRKARRLKAVKEAIPIKRIKLGDLKQALTTKPVNTAKAPPPKAASSKITTVPANPSATRIESVASMDKELSNLVERWYGQDQDLDDLEYQEPVVRKPQQPKPSNTFTNSQLCNKVIENAFNPNGPSRRPAISVKPMSQLLGPNSIPATPPPPLVAINAFQNEEGVQLASLNDVIEIDDDEPPAPVPSTSTAPPPTQATEQQKALSENDIMNIVKHFRGIDENESYLVKAKINGSQKLICISKRKGEGSGTLANPNTNAIKTAKLPTNLPAMTVKPNLNVPTARPAPMVSGALAATSKPATVVSGIQNKTAFKNPSIPQTSMPQLKITHVQSLGQAGGTSAGQANGKSSPALNRPSISGQQAPRRMLKPVATQVPPLAVAAGSSSTVPKGPRNIIVGSNSLNMLNMPKAPNTNPRPPGGPSVSQSATGTIQRRFIVQRKPAQTVTQSLLNRSPNNITVATSSGSERNSLLRNQLTQLPPKQYPIQQQQQPRQQMHPVISAVSSRGGTVPLQNGIINALNDTTLNNFQLNNTIIRRVE